VKVQNSMQLVRYSTLTFFGTYCNLDIALKNSQGLDFSKAVAFRSDTTQPMCWGGILRSAVYWGILLFSA